MLEWKQKAEAVTRTQAEFSPNKMGYDNKTFFVNTKDPVRKYVVKGQRWCPRFNPETFGRVKDFSAIHRIKCFDFVCESVSNQDVPYVFYKKDILGLIDPKGLSDGSLQLRILQLLTCKGKISKKRIDKGSKGQQLKMPKYKFVKQTQEKCPFLFEEGCLCCTFDWRNEAERTYFLSEDSQ
jgi:hypothetical protein